jgi:multisubunit Na+/H+ antiporter MnhB subunit
VRETVQSYILRAATRLLVGLILVFSVYLLFRGHNAPGGGFSAALVAGTAFRLFAIAEGPRSGPTGPADRSQGLDRVGAYCYPFVPV